MAERTEISWADATFNPWVGCTKVSPACDGCYAEAMMADRYGRVIWGAPGKGEGTRARTSAANWKQPLAWNRKAALAYEDWARDPIGRPPQSFVFCASLADVFDNAVPAEWRRDFFDLIRATPNLTWLLLTKRPGNIEKMAAEAGGWPSNAAAGTTCEDRVRTSQNLRRLLNRCWPEPPAFFFGSFEPLLEDVSDIVSDYLGPARLHHETGFPWLGWVIAGGETDQGKHKARPSNPAWFRGLRDQCFAAGVPFHLKQHGEWLGFDYESPCVSTDPLTGSLVVKTDGRRFDKSNVVAWKHPYPVVAAKVGKKAAGRLLDGALHDARPEVVA